MLDILQFIFQSFWHWFGTLLLVGTVAGILRGVITINNIYNKEKEDNK